MESSRDIWNRLLNAGLVEGEEPPKLEAKSPWYVKLLLALSGWAGALFLVLFVGGSLVLVLGQGIERIPVLLTLIGGGVIFFAYTIFKEKQSEFLEHFMLALSVAGQAMVIASIFFMMDGGSSRGSIYLFIFFFQAFLMWLIPNYIHRVLSSFFMGLSLIYLFYTTYEYHLVSMILTSVVAWLWMSEFKFSDHSRVEAIAYGQTGALVWKNYFFMVVPYSYREYQAPLFTYELSLFGLLVTLSYVIWMLLKESQKLEDKRVLILSAVAVVLLALFSLNIGSLIVGVILLLIGYAHSHRLLIGLGVISSLVSLSHYYYFTGETFMAKAGLLLMLGVGLLLSRFVMKLVLKKELKDV